jgi:hypothetical protein
MFARMGASGIPHCDAPPATGTPVTAQGAPYSPFSADRYREQAPSRENAQRACGRVTAGLSGIGNPDTARQRFGFMTRHDKRGIRSILMVLSTRRPYFS